MGKYTSAFWEPDGSGRNKAERKGGTYYPYVPDELSSYNFLLEPTAAKAVSQAQAALEKLNESSVLTDTEPLARLLLRAEAVSSSRIEGLEIPASKLLEYEELDRLGVDHRLDAVEAQVLGNVHALAANLAQNAPEPCVTADILCEINRILLQGTPVEELGGQLRQEQNWIGGNRINPIGAAYVPPAPGLVPALVQDLIAFLKTTELPVVAAAAIAHAQFETIHPFVDGNGRVGRALIHLVLKSAGALRTTVPPVSLMFATDKDRYIANLASYRCGEGESFNEKANGWIEYFANTLLLSCERAEEFEKQLDRIRASWRQATSFRKDSAGSQLITLLPGTPAISIKTAQKLTGKSYPAARSAVLALEEAGILRQNAKNRKSGIYVADEILDAFNAYERSLATLSGDTAVEEPKRRVPQRRKQG